MNLNPSSSRAQVPKVELPAGQRVPRFTNNVKLEPTGFWTNLRDFLMERPVRLPQNGHEVFRNDGLDESFGGSLKAFFQPAPRIKGSAGGAGTAEGVAGTMEVDWEPGYRVFYRNVRDLISPPKLPPLKLTSKPVAVRSLWAKREKFGLSQGISIGAHVALVILLFALARTVIQAEQPTQPISFDVTDVSPYLTKLPPAKTRAGGGGGGGERMPTPPTRGKVPRFTMTQLAPPMAVPRNPDPKLAVEPTLLGPPDLKVPSPNDPNFGDPLAKFMTNSGGPGGGGGIGTGSGGGIGSGNGGGLGPGSGGGTGGGAFRAGVGGVGMPTCIYCPSPEYSEDARKAKYQGTVLLEVVIEPDGHATNIRVVKGPGLGLDEKAIDAVKNWRFKPAAGPDGKIVATVTAIEVNFRLL